MNYQYCRKGRGHVIEPGTSIVPIFRTYPPRFCSELSTEHDITSRITIHQNAYCTARCYCSISPQAGYVADPRFVYIRLNIWSKFLNNASSNPHRQC